MAKQNKYKARMPQQDRGINTKERILTAAEKLFIKKGFYGTSSKQIVSKAGVSIGSFYDYFHDKRDVFIAIIWERIQRTTVAIKEYLNTWDRSNDLREVVAALIAITKENLTPELFREITILRYHDPVIEDLQGKTIQAVSELLMPWIQSFGKKLRTNDLEAGIEMLIMSTMEIVHATTIHTQRIQHERIFKELADMINRYLLGDSVDVNNHSGNKK